MIRLQWQSADGEAAPETNPAGIAAALKREGNLVWLDVRDPTNEDLHFLRDEVGLPSLPVSDLALPHQRPKLKLYDHICFIVFYALDHDKRALSHQIQLFAGPNYLVTVHHGKLPAIAETAARWQQASHGPDQQSVGMLVYTLLDAVVDGYFPWLDAMTDRVSGIEEHIFEQVDRTLQRQLFRLRHDLLLARRVLAPERDVVNELIRRESPIFDPSTLNYFQDVYDHVLRATDLLDLYHQMLSDALDALLSVTANRLNQVMKTLTAWSIIFMSVTLIASIYGMNFHDMPELSWPFGYGYALGVMATLAAAMLILFRRIDWL